MLGKVMANPIAALLEILIDMKNNGTETIPIHSENLAFLRNPENFTRNSSPSDPVRREILSVPGDGVAAIPSPDHGGKKIRSAENISYPNNSHSPQKFPSKREHWEDLRQRIFNNELLKQHVRPGKKLVFGVGNLDADIFFCGEAPGADEEVQGIPFVGRAGQLLTKIIHAMGLSREDVYIGNIMNWRPEMDTPTGNRPPTQEEMQFCLPYLIEQVEIVRPKVIVALGATAVSGLLGYDKNRKMSSVRGQWHEFYGIALMVTFHPSYLLRNGSIRMKRIVWEDMLKVMERVGMAISEKQRNYFLES
ncbi:MAG: uracil-DNA glycosylase [Puniceicoccales bacterium]|jgi:DNA polymerase|nr:uracil-DNA glycosylase [Puniceicoccales bacterium]